MWPCVSLLWFSSKRRNLLLAKSQHFLFFPHPRANFWLAWEQLPVFLFAARQWKNVLMLEAWLHPTQGAECINFLTRNLCQAVYRSPSQTAKLTESPVSLALVPMSVKEMSTYFRSLWQSDTFYHVHQVNRKKNTYETLRNQKCHYLIASPWKQKQSNPLSSLRFG